MITRRCTNPRVTTRDELASTDEARQSPGATWLATALPGTNGADDPTAAHLTFDHLCTGLVRVALPLPPNMDVIDLAGNVGTLRQVVDLYSRFILPLGPLGLPPVHGIDSRACDRNEHIQKR